MTKIGIVGLGAVGAACAMAVILRGFTRELVLVDRTRRRAKAVATDMRYGAPLSDVIDVRDGDYADLAGAALVMVTVGVNEKTGGATDRGDPAGRLKLLDANAAIYREVIPRVVAAAPDAAILVVSDPPDPLADLTRQLAGHDRVLSTGTFLDSLRFRVHLADRFAVSPASVEAQVVGEHGTSEVFLWSSARIGGVPLMQAVGVLDIPPEQLRREIEGAVRYANITIIEGIGASQYGIGMASARIAQMVLRDERAVVPIGSYNPAYGVTLSLPAVVGRSGVMRILEAAGSADEMRALQASAETLRDAGRRIAETRS
ncbi:MAG: lactate dehydrogenase [Phenylobacterium sp.]|nr:lactate dehydrogenase [Phenylobacterium sp.]